PARERADRIAHRPLPLLPVLHDHLPFRGALHASGRPWPEADRGNLCPPLAGARPAPPAGGSSAPSAALPARPDGSESRAALSHGSAGTASTASGDGTGPPAVPLPRRPAPGLSGAGRAACPCRAAERLRAAGAIAGDQRGDDPPALPPRGGSGGRRGRRLLRRPGPSPGQGGSGAAGGPGE